jgi:hypothetical protein
MQAQAHAQRMQHERHLHEQHMAAQREHYANERDALAMEHYKRLANLWQGLPDDAQAYDKS